MTQDDATRAHRAALKLRRLYHAHRANARAIGIEIQTVRRRWAEEGGEPDAERLQALQTLAEQFAHAQALDLAMAERLDGLETRIEELQGWAP